MNNYTLWITGLSGSGKSTIAKEYIKKHPNCIFIDGDILRKGLSSDLSYSKSDRIENMRRLREICKLINNNGQNVITAFISPIEKERQKAKQEIKNCYIIYCDSSLEICEKRDVKGLYKKARLGEIKNFTGIGSPYDVPEKADLIINTGNKSLKECMNEVFKFIKTLK